MSGDACMHKTVSYVLPCCNYHHSADTYPDGGRTGRGLENSVVCLLMEGRALGSRQARIDEGNTLNLTFNTILTSKC